MMRSLLVLVGLVLALGVVGLQVTTGERIRADGEEVLLPLAPRDPRSLVQGDYMRLRWQLERQRVPDGAAPEHAVLVLDADHVGTFARFDDTRLAPDERRIDITVVDHRIDAVPDAWLFQEGHAEVYASARYGVVALTDSGEALLVGLADESFNRLGR